VKENDSHLHLDGEVGRYPPSLVKLLRLNYSIGARIRKEVKE
jgi:hypothetical protein